MKTRIVNVALHMTVFKTIWNCREIIENKDNYSCFMTILYLVLNTEIC